MFACEPFVLIDGFVCLLKMAEPNEDDIAEMKMQIKHEEPLEIYCSEVAEEPLEIFCSEVIDKVVQKHYESAETSTSIRDANKYAALLLSNEPGKVKCDNSASTSKDCEYLNENIFGDKLGFDIVRPTFVDCGGSGGNVQGVEEVSQPSSNVRREGTVSESDGDIWSDDSSSEENFKRKQSGSESDIDNENGDSGSGGREVDGYVSAMTATNPYFIYMPSWRSNSDCMRNLEFEAENKIIVPYPVGNKPVDWFTLLMDLFNRIIEETNSFGNKRVRFPQSPRNRPKKPSSRPSKAHLNFTSLQLSELKLFIGILLHMGTVKCNRLKDYWCIDPIFGMKYIRERMVRSRFLAILKDLSFFKESSTTQAKMLVSRFNDIMAKVYYPDRELVVEEGVVLWKGLKSFANDEGKGMFKLYSLSETAGPVVKIMCSEFERRHFIRITIHQTAIIKSLMEDKCSGHSLVVNNQYLGFTMAKELLEANIYCTGYLNPDSLEIPADLKQTKLKEGETAKRYADGVMIGKWRKNRQESYYLSTEFDNTMVVSTSKHGKCREMPLPILKLKFKKNMHVAEVTRPLMDYYPTVAIHSLPWHKRIFLHLLQIMILNAHKLFNIANLTLDREPMEFHQFRVQVIRELMGTNQFKGTKRSFPEPCSSPGKRQNTGKGSEVRHPLAKIMVKTKDGKRTSRRRCRVCSMEKIFSQTTYMCAQCPGQPALCAIPCFDKYHTI